MLDIYKIISNTKVEGPGNRFCIWTQGCHKHCKGCFATETWEFGCGKKYSVEQMFNLINSEKDIEGVTFLGGEPFEQAKDLSALARLVKEKGLSVVCFTGYTLDELKQKKASHIEAFLNNIDLLIDGGFEQENFDLTRPWVGSLNQKYHFLTDFYTVEDIKKCKNKIEARISTDGRLEINGMGDFKMLRENFCLQLGKDNVK